MANARYDAVADFYQAGWSSSPDDEVSTALLNQLGPVAGLQILDIACGHGRMTRELACRGASVVGVDISAELIARARAAEGAEPLGVQYLHADISDAGATVSLADAGFDAIVCSFGLSDIDDLDGAVATVARTLRPDGCFVLSMLHPCFAGGRDVSGSWSSTSTYWAEGWWLADGAMSTLRNRVGANHRMLSTYVNTLRRHSLWVDEMLEPGPPPEWADERPDVARLPVFLVVRCVKR